MNVNAQFLEFIRADFNQKSKLLKAYATLLPRLKDRTDAFILSQKDQLMLNVEKLSKTKTVLAQYHNWLSKNIGPEMVLVLRKTDFVATN